MNQPFITYAIYDNPKDFPGKIVVRRWSDTTPDQEPTAVCENIETARAAIPPGYYRMPPEPGDDPVIKEVWM